jgi:hypothetical protein
MATKKPAAPKAPKYQLRVSDNVGKAADERIGWAVTR